MIYHSLFMQNEILCGDCLDVLKTIPPNHIDLIITSPPYFQQRDYGNGTLGIGNEVSETEYLQHLTDIFRECVRVTKETGAIVFNLGDLVLDPFCGSGTTCLADRNLNRAYLGIEINPDYVALATARLEKEPVEHGLIY